MTEALLPRKAFPMALSTTDEHRVSFPALLTAILLLLTGCQPNSATRSGADGVKEVHLLNVSYDPTRELYEAFNKGFVAEYERTHGVRVTIDQSHGGSGKQARAVIDGLEADVVTLALGFDIDVIAERGLIASDWRSRFPSNSAPYTSTIVFLVRKGNPKQIHDWKDLVKPGVEIITPNPKTSGGARWNYLAAWGAELHRQLGGFEALKDPAAAETVEAANKSAREFVTALFQRVPVLDTGARGSTNTFVQRGIGDVLLAWENEAFLALKQEGADKLEIVVPSISILAEPPVAIVDSVVDRRGTREVAEAYLQHLYSPFGQQLAAQHFYRPAHAELLSQEQRDQFADVELFKLEDVFGTWAEVQAEHFADGGIFDQIYQPAK